MKGIHLTKHDVEAHQARHGFLVPQVVVEDAPRIVVPKSRMNKVEIDFSLILEAKRRRGDIVSWVFEGVTFRLADDCRFTPDFFVIVSLSPLLIQFCETKGRHVWDDAKVKFRVAKEQHPWADWIMYQKGKEGWKQLL